MIVCRIYDIRSGRYVETLTGHKVHRVDAKCAANNRSCLYSFHAPVLTNVQGSVQCLQFDDYKIVSGSWDTSVIVGYWNAMQYTCTCTCSYNNYHAIVRVLVYFNLWSFFVTARVLFPVDKVWDVVHFAALNVLNGHMDCVPCLQFDEEKL